VLCYIEFVKELNKSQVHVDFFRKLDTFPNLKLITDIDANKI